MQRIGFGFLLVSVALLPMMILGPLEVLVSANPFFAATILFWLAPWALILAGYAVFAAAMVRFSSTKTVLLIQRPGVLLATALLFGFAFATPWFYGVYCLAVFH